MFNIVNMGTHDSTTTSTPQAIPQVPDHLNSTGCRIAYSEGKGRGVFASRNIEAQTVIEISPVLLFAQKEYEDYGGHTILDDYTFKWRDGRMALALGLGSLFNHSQTPNVSYTIDVVTESIRYITTRHVMQDEELCIFYGHKLWFQAVDSELATADSGETDDGWGGLSVLNDGADGFEAESRCLLDGDPADIISEDDLPFTRLKSTPEDEEEEDMDAIQTEQAWVVDLTDPKQTATMLRWLKQSGLETAEMAHLKRIRRRQDQKLSLLLTYTRYFPHPPELPQDIELPMPYNVSVPRSAALTFTSLQLKNSLWPTVYAPRRKGEAEKWSRGKLQWAYDAMRRVVQEAKQVQQHGEMPIVAYVPIPYEAEIRSTAQLAGPFIAHDTRNSLKHPLRHAVLNVIRAVAEYRASPSSPNGTAPDITVDQILASVTAKINLSPSDVPSDASSDPSAPMSRSGAHYLLTSLTLFTTHEPCIMCSMALLHSRVKEIFYMVPMDGTGGSGGAACVPRLHGVNHRFGINRWRKGKEMAEESGIGIDPDADA